MSETPLSTGEMQRAAQPRGDIREDGGGAGARGHQAHEVHVLPGEGSVNLDQEIREGPRPSTHTGLGFCAMLLIHLVNTL